MSKKIIYTNGEMVGNCKFIHDADTRISKNLERRRFAMFECICGNNFEAQVAHVRAKNIISCGCIGKERRRAKTFKHGECIEYGRSPEYSALYSLRARCYRITHPEYRNYGARGITVCDRWLNKENGLANFLIDMGKRPSNNHSIERIDNNNGYTKDNCKWATRIEQLMNRRNTKLYTYKGETKHLNDWALELNISKDTLWRRINKQKMSFEEAVTAPIVRKRKYLKK